MRARKHAFAKYLVVILTLLWSAALVSGPIWAAAAPGAQPAVRDSLSKAQVVEGYGRLPLFFMENQGQTDSQVKFYTQGKGHAIFFTPSGMVLSMSRISGEADRNKTGKGKDGRTVVQLRPQGMRSNVEILATDSLPGKVNYFKGSDPGNWRTDIPTYKTVLYREAYKGIDLKFYGAGQQLEYDLVVKPGADPKQAKFLFQGVKALKVTKEGDLDITLPDGGKLVQQKPVIYQEIEGQRISREGKFRILPGTHNRGYGFELASYDTRYPLIIDPVTLAYSTYVGGALWESGNAIAVDASGSAYVAGTTQSPNFITAMGAPAGFQAVYGGDPEDAFVAKFNVAGSALVYATFLGGSGDDIGLGIAVDAAGNAYVTGETSSANFPVTPLTAFQTALATGALNNAFVTKLGPTGTLAYSTYLGGGASDVGVACAVDNAGNAYVAGNTTSANFPTAGSHVQVALSGAQDAFVAKINPNLSGAASLPYSTFLGGTTSETAWGVAVAPTGAFIYVAGDTDSLDFPVSGPPFSTNPSPFQATLKGAVNAFVAKINPAVLGLPGLAYSTYLGGTGIDSGSGGVAVDIAGNMYVAGNTSSVDFPVSTGAFQTGLATGAFSNAFVTKINPTVSGAASLVYSTYLGGNDVDTAWWITVDAGGNAYVTGDTSSTNFPVVSANTFQATLKGSSNAFVTRLNSLGTGLMFSTYLGGTNADVGFGVALDPNQRIYVTGLTQSTNFPVKGAIKTTLGSLGSSAFVTKLSTFTMEPAFLMLDLL